MLVALRPSAWRVTRREHRRAPPAARAHGRRGPLTVSGRQFRAHERVSLVLHQPSGTTRRRARAGKHGVFRKVFAGVAVDRCSGFWVSAKGSAGSRAMLVRRALPQCPPA